MPTRPQTTWNKRASPLEKQQMNEMAMRRKEQESNERFAQLNKRVDAENAAKKAVADVKSFASKPKAGGTPAGRFGGQQGAMQNTAAKKAAKKAANDRSDVQMSKRVQSPNTTPRESPNPSQRLSSLHNPMTSSPRPPQKPMTSSPRPPKKPAFKPWLIRS